MVLEGAGGGLGRGRAGQRPAGASRPLDVWQRGFPSRSIGFSGACEIFSKDRAEVDLKGLKFRVGSVAKQVLSRLCVVR
jgi:hypothetical protein